MRLSRVTAGSKPAPSSPSLPARRFSPSMRRSRLSSRTRVLSPDAVEFVSPCLPDLDSERLLIESTHVRSKVQDVLALAARAERQLEDLLAALHLTPNQQQLRVSKRLEFKGHHDPTHTVATTRTPASSSVNSHTKRIDLPLPDFSRDLLSPFMGGKTVPVLTRDEEKELAFKIQEMLPIEDVRQEWRHLHSQWPSWDEIGEAMQDDPMKLERIYQTGRAAKQTMIDRNMRLVISVAAKQLEKGESLLDIVVDGTTGLVRAIDKFDPERGYKLSTYAHWWIRQSIVRARRQNARVVKVPGHIPRLFRDFMATTTEYREEHGMEPSDEELRARLGYSQKRLETVRNAFLKPVRIEESLSKDANSATRADFIADEKNISPVGYYAKKAMAQDLDVLVSTLPERESTILRMRYGLEDGREYTLKEIGSIYHITRERVRQLEAKAIRKLRRRAFDTLKEYLEPEEQSATPTVAAAFLKAQ